MTLFIRRAGARLGALRPRAGELFSACDVTPGGALISAVVLLLAAGTVMVYSASFFHRSVDGDPYFFLRRQALWLPIAIFSGVLAARLDYRSLARIYPALLFVTAVLLALVFAPGVGRQVNGARRWLFLGPMQFQPSELAKLTALLFVAGFLSRDPERARRFFRGFAPVCGGTFLLVGLILVEPDFGTALFVLLLSGLVMAIAGVRKRYGFLCLLSAAPPIAAFMRLRWEQVRPRLLAFVEPEQIYQVKQSLLAFGTGGVSGVGLGAGGMKLKFLPEPQTDFILAVIGEELGFAGSLVVIVLFVVLLIAGVAIARRAADYFGFLLASGIVLALSLQALINIAVVTASAPTKGIPLPFITFGGSALVMTLIEIGLLLSVDRAGRAARRPAPAPAPSPLLEAAP